MTYGWIVFNHKLILVERPQYWKDKNKIGNAIAILNYRRTEKLQMN